MRKLTVLLLSVMVIMALFVSCTVEVNEDTGDTVTLRFTTDEAEGMRSLTASKQTFNASLYTWKYTATKCDSASPSTGAQDNEVIVGTNGALTEEVGPFSIGEWNFTLSAYSKETTPPLVYKGTANNVIITNSGNGAQSVPITVEPVKTSDGKGTLDITNTIQFKVGDTPFTANKCKVTSVVSGGTSDAVYKDIATSDYTNLLSGVYKVEVAYKNSEGDDDTDYTYATNYIYVNVWNGLTTTVSGDLDEATKYTQFNATENVDGSYAQSCTIANSTEEQTFTFSYSPSAIANLDSTSTTIKGSFVFDNNDNPGSLTLVVYGKETFSKESVKSKFSAGLEDGAVIVEAGFDIIVVGADLNSDSTPITVTTYIGKNLSVDNMKLQRIQPLGYAAKCESVSEESQLDDDKFYYEASTGKLVFKTIEFNPFVVTYAE